MKNDRICWYKTELNISNAIVASAEAANPTGLPLAKLFKVDEETNEYEHGETLETGGFNYAKNPNDGDYFVRTDFT